MARLTALLLLTLSLAAQEPRGTLEGLATDHTDAVVAGVAVRAVNVDTGVVTRAVTNQQGAYEIPFLLPGPYRVEAEHAGFKSWVRAGVELRMEDTLRLDIRLEVGNVSEMVNVTAEAPIIDEASGNIGQVMDSRQLSEMPLRSGSLAWAYSMAPGVVMNDRPYDGPWNIDQASNISVAGSRGYGADFNVDGVSNNSYGGRTAFVPPADMVQEMRVNVTAYDASLGRGTGGSINVSLKTGTNKVRGSINVSGSGGPLMTRNFFTNRYIFDPATGPITAEKIAANTPDVKWMRYSAAVGGPVFIPRLFDGRNRTFWMFGWQTHDRTRPQTNLYATPTEPQRRGDFSALLAVGSQYQVYDPATTRPDSATRFRRQPFAGNIIPISRIDPVAAKVIKEFPLPNSTGTVDGLDNMQHVSLNTQVLHQPVLRVDHNFSERNRFFARYAQSNFAGHFDQFLPDSTARGRQRRRPYRGAAIDDVMVLSNRLVLDVRYGFTWFQERQFYDNSGYDVSQFGFPKSLIGAMDPQGISFPEIAIADLLTIGNDGGLYQTNYNHSLLGTLTWMRGNHGVKFGADGRVLYANEKAYDNVSPHLDFAEAWTRGPLDNAAVAPTGQGLASFLLGLPTAGVMDLNDSRAAATKYLALFVQDDWRATRRLTLNLGLRWEYESPVTERFNRMTRDFDFTTPNPAEAAARAQYARSPIPEIPAGEFRLLGGPRFAGVGGVPTGLRDPVYRTLMPRVGFAWRILPKTVVRGGYGLYYDLLGVEFTDVPQPGFNQRTNAVISTDTGVSYAGSISNPFPFGIVQPQGSAGGLRTYLGRSPGFFSADGRRPYTQRWSFSMQMQPARQSLIELGYIGSRGVRLRVSRDFNAVPARYLSTLPVRDQTTINLLTAGIANPFLGVDGFDGSGLYTARNTNRTQLLRPYPQFAALTAEIPSGSSWYHAMTARFERRFSRGLFLQANYTWSKFLQAASYLNVSDDLPEHVAAAFDRPHRIAVTGMYELPFGRWAGKPLRKVVGGWQAVAIFNGQSGPPLGFGNSLLTGTYREVKLPLGERTVDRWFATENFNRVNNQQLANNIRTMPSRVATVRADGINVWDFSLQRNFSLNERWKLQFRAQAEGAMNHPNFAVPNTAPTNSLFGRVSATQGGGQEERRIFFGLKASF